MCAVHNLFIVAQQHAKFDRSKGAQDFCSHLRSNRATLFPKMTPERTAAARGRLVDYVKWAFQKACET